MAWYITKKDIPFISIGAKFLGCGGGGDTVTSEFLLESVMKENDKVRVLSFTELTTEFILSLAMAGSPVLYSEQLPRGDEGTRVIENYERLSDIKVDALVSIEIGGMNALTPIITALQTNLPVVDGDGMGRAFPEFTMTTFNFFNIPFSPASIIDVQQNAHTITCKDNNEAIDKTRELINNEGGIIHISCFGAVARKVKHSMIPGSLSLARSIGKVLDSKKKRSLKIKELEEVLDNSVYSKPVLIMEGTIKEVSRYFEKGQIRGNLSVTGNEAFKGKKADIVFHNEYLLVKQQGRTRVSVPDLIILMDARTLIPLTTNEVQEGMTINIFSITAPNVLRTRSILDFVGPKAFGQEEDYQPLTKWKENELL
ncbi:DUF917 family protein [Evansella sp. LMS18]|jgi:DUF917 family protein|uniref:DUF917 domain-containing protein n=1 Tax=Evansella sp. LMS18 TaxID=2924033 RepID=UPI0020D19305|nr:DUF917 family protein [Evansella sp. LMS18]UTR11948.1 DUF917 family protein [Evansella sp. LMS18]